MAHRSHTVSYGNLFSAVRNNYFYGKKLDVAQFELEQNYYNNKRRLLNRLVSGYGVVCGLNVTLADDYQSVIVSPGLAIDKCGREIVVYQPSEPYGLPAPPEPEAQASGAQNPNPAKKYYPFDEIYVHLSICYEECLISPVPGLGGDCDPQVLCAPGEVVERYRLELDDGELDPVSPVSRIPDAIANGQVVYSVLANYVSNRCPEPDDDCCIPLANIRVPHPGESYDRDCIDITVRPIVYTNDLLYELILAMNPTQYQARGSKP